jgi:hypothetical protein
MYFQIDLGDNTNNINLKIGNQTLLSDINGNIAMVGNVFFISGYVNDIPFRKEADTFINGYNFIRVEFSLSEDETKYSLIASRSLSGSTEGLCETDELFDTNDLFVTNCNMNLSSYKITPAIGQPVTEAGDSNLAMLIIDNNGGLGINASVAGVLLNYAISKYTL